MRRFVSSVVFICLLCAASSSSAQERGFVQGFGGLRLDGGSTTDAAFGGAAAGRLTPNVQIVGEAGRISNVLPSTIYELLELAGPEFELPAWYGTAGVRFTTNQSSAVRPYAETSAGFAWLRPDVRGLGGVFGVFGNVASPFLNQTDPIASVGGGVTFERGGFVADAGYRYRRIFSSSWVNALTLSDRLNTSEVRVGIGLRF